MHIYTYIYICNVPAATCEASTKDDCLLHCHEQITKTLSFSFTADQNKDMASFSYYREKERDRVKHIGLVGFCRPKECLVIKQRQIRLVSFEQEDLIDNIDRL